MCDSAAVVRSSECDWSMIVMMMMVMILLIIKMMMMIVMKMMVMIVMKIMMKMMTLTGEAAAVPRQLFDVVDNMERWSLTPTLTQENSNAVA